MSKPVEQIVTRPEDLPEVCAHLAAAGRFGFDTEFVGEDTYRPRLCLVQVATEERLVLIDPFSAGPLDEFWKLIVNPAHQVIVHAAREEIRLCYLWTGQTPGNLFDLQIAAGLAGLAYPLSHGALVSQLLGMTLSKTETLTEWRDRPLTDKQIRYAFDDVRHLLALGQELEDRLGRLDRLAWAQEEFSRLAVIATEEEPSLEKWRRIRGLGSLNRRQLAVVRELYRWREEAALQANRPPRTICRDDLLIEIARRNPTRERDLHVVRGLRRRDSEPILQAVERARALPMNDCPAAAEREQDPPQVQWLTSLLAAVHGQLCMEMRLAPNLVCTAQDLRWLVRVSTNKPPAGEPSLLNEGWRREHIRPALEAVLRGEKLVKVARLRGDTPFEFLPLGPDR